ncbi:type VI secretion system protein [Niveispirillum irakense]|uniref:type VI secretion system protein n=1 Tax=Niveispirillum irakense TaxID=34011 RepID=UPI0004268C81|nr:type VI secretion system protein [Niveispirillum irakense]
MQEPSIPPVGAENGDVRLSRMESIIKDEAKRLRRAGPSRDGTDPLYDKPWFLMAGTQADRTTHLLEQARADSPDHAAMPADGAGWRWWHLRQCIIIELAHDLLCTSDNPQAWRQMEAAMTLLLERRRHRPLDGLVMVVSVPLSDQEAERLGRHMRALAFEARQTLGMNIPVHLVVSGCDRLRGYEWFFGHMGRDSAQQALGHRFDPPISGGTGPAAFTMAMDRLLERLHALRLGYLLEAPQGQPPLEAWLFVEEFSALCTALSRLVDMLVSDSAATRPASLRSVYFTADTGSHPHVGDAFTRFLPADAPLTRREKSR